MAPPLWSVCSKPQRNPPPGPQLAKRKWKSGGQPERAAGQSFSSWGRCQMTKRRYDGVSAHGLLAAPGAVGPAHHQCRHPPGAETIQWRREGWRGDSVGLLCPPCQSESNPQIKTPQRDPQISQELLAQKIHQTLFCFDTKMMKM